MTRRSDGVSDSLMSQTSLEADAEQGVDGPGHQGGRVPSAPPRVSASSAQRSTTASAPGRPGRRPAARRTPSRTASAGGPAGRATASRHRASRPPPAVRSAVGPGPVAAVVVGQQREPHRHRVAARRGAVPRRTPGCRATSTSSRRRARPSRRARSAGRTASVPVRTWPSEALISWCGNTRSLPPPCTSNAVAEVAPARSPRTRRASPAGRGRSESAVSQDGSPGRAACQSRQSSGCFFPGRGRGRRRARRTARASCRRRSCRRRRSAGRRAPRSRCRPRRRTPRPARAAAGSASTMSRDRLDRADVARPAGAPRARSCPRGTARSRAPPAHASPRRRAVARSSSGSSTSVTFCT